MVVVVWGEWLGVGSQIDLVSVTHSGPRDSFVRQRVLQQMPLVEMASSK